MILHWPQVMMLVFIIVRVVAHVFRNGENATGVYSGGGAVIHAVAMSYILYAGGFWS